MSKSGKNQKKKLTVNSSDELEKIDQDLKELIDKNESLKKGISKLFIEIEKNPSSLTSN
ncbi:hypothetical protein N9J65_06230 [Flavobacteriaceae bacterium]|nr:hypothetical protein [Flavobacteriaceae bacterium]